MVNILLSRIRTLPMEERFLGVKVFAPDLALTIRNALRRLEGERGMEIGGKNEQVGEMKKVSRRVEKVQRGGS